ncbi:MAG TPA: YidC/Oxa1 family membrane protein insertase [Thermoleophilaceae bacterium]|nr:YidC/Oxa1 family membrane protein insertase [Thermoleophilaceae bacterium]
MPLLPIAIIPQPFLTVLEDVLTFWHELVGGSWGWAIILLTFTIRILILPLTFKGVKSMQRLQVLQPEMKKIQERYKDDRQRMNQEMMKFYQENKVNPLGSCLPLLLQIPFFIALFELLRSDSFKADIASNAAFGPINDLAEPLTGQPVVLAFTIVLYVATQLIATMITSIGGDKTQQRIMMALPFVFVIFIINFEAGLIVYWITTNIWTIGQQLVVRKLYPRPDLSDDAAVPAGAVALAGKSGSKQASKANTSGNGSAKAPPPSPRKKKKRSGRRR